MKRSKTQAVYRFLPEMWISEKGDSERAVSAKIKNWNYIKMADIYEDFIEGEVKRQIKLFGDRGGDISAFDISPDTHSFAIVETACNEGIPDIIGEISPLVFYCSSCGTVSDLRNPDAVDKYTWKCKNPDCGKWAVKQLQMIYACECGYAQPIKVPYVQGVKDFKFRPNETQYKMFYRSGNSEKPAEFVQICPNCNSRLVPDNANSGRNYKPFTLKVINLVDQRNGQFYKKGIDAQKTIVCRWFDKLSTTDYEEILNNIELAFSDAFKSDAQRRNVEQQVRALIDAGMLPSEMFESAVNNMLQNAPNTKSVERYVAMCDDLFSRKKTEDPVGYAEWLSHFSFKLMQYDTLKYAKRIITLEEAIQRQLDMEFIDSPEEVTALNKKLGIANILSRLDDVDFEAMSGIEKRMMQMFYITIWGKAVEDWNSEEVLDNLYALSDSTRLLGELISLLQYRFEQIDFIDEPVNLGFDCPLDLHCTYTRDQLLVAMDFMKPATVREGVKWLLEKQLDVFFVTLNKADKDYSPTTMYNDYSINESLFHWQSQSTTAADSPTGQRYIHHRDKGTKVLLFVREFKSDRITNGAEAYTYLGTANYVTHTGSKPMNITWHLDRPIPAKFLKKTNKLVVG